MPGPWHAAGGEGEAGTTSGGTVGGGGAACGGQEWNRVRGPARFHGARGADGSEGGLRWMTRGGISEVGGAHWPPTTQRPDPSLTSPPSPPLVGRATGATGLSLPHSSVGIRVGGLGRRPRMSLLCEQLAVAIRFKTHQHVVSLTVGRGTNTLRICTAVIFVAECKSSAMAERPAAPQEHKQRCSLDFTTPARQ